MKKNNIIFTSVLVALVMLFASVYTLYEKTNQLSFTSTVPDKNITVVIDAGHGGVDGGTSGADNSVEKDINLKIAKKLETYLALYGIKTVMTRTEDITVADESAKTIKEKKTSDLKNRMKLINETPNSVLISIHQNHYTSEKYVGTQVFYSGNNNESASLAMIIQSNVKEYLQKDNNRLTKMATDDLFLLYQAQRPSVMVECGFMSNPQENKKLQNEEYQSQLAYCIALSVNEYINQLSI